MTKRKQPLKAVTLTAPGGAKVTVGEGSVEKFKALGYKGVPGRPKVEKPDEK